MSRSLVDLGLALVGWLFIVAAPVRFVIHILVPATNTPRPMYFAAVAIVAILPASLYWQFEKSLRRLGDFIFSLVAFQLSVSVVVLAVLVVYDVTLTTETIPGVLFTGGYFSAVYLGAYYHTYGDGFVSVLYRQAQFVHRSR